MSFNDVDRGFEKRWEKENMLMTSSFSFDHNVLKLSENVFEFIRE